MIWAWVTKQNQPPFASPDIFRQNLALQNIGKTPVWWSSVYVHVEVFKSVSPQTPPETKIKTETPFSALLGWLNLGFVIANGWFLTYIIVSVTVQLAQNCDIELILKKYIFNRGPYVCMSSQLPAIVDASGDINHLTCMKPQTIVAQTTNLNWATKKKTLVLSIESWLVYSGILIMAYYNPYITV